MGRIQLEIKLGKLLKRASYPNSQARVNDRKRLYPAITADPANRRRKNSATQDRTARSASALTMLN